jgi:peptidoglycan/LPS O-acetylase OafA/YrhL
MKRLDISTDNNFTVLRLLLALAVVLGHFKLLSGTHYPAFPFNLADAAVDAFFVVSGYLIALSYERDRDPLPFHARRIFRLYPMYACVVLLQTAVMLTLLPGGPFSEPHATLRYLTTNLLLANFLQYDIGGVLAGLPNPGINPSLWTLKIEIGFYLIAPLICGAARRWGGWTLTVIFVASVAYDLMMQHLGQERLARQLPGQLQFFVIGMALYLYREPRRVHPVVSLVATAAFLMAWTFIEPIPAGIRPVIVAAFVYCAAFSAPVIRVKSDISYSVYLLHGPMLQTLILLGLLRDTPLWLAGVTAAVVALSAVTAGLVERPGIALGQRLARRLKGAVPIAANVAG